MYENHSFLDVLFELITWCLCNELILDKFICLSILYFLCCTLYHLFIVSPTSVILHHNNNLISYCGQTIRFTVEFGESFPNWESIFWTMDGKTISNSRFFINTDVSSFIYKILNCFSWILLYKSIFRKSFLNMEECQCDRRYILLYCLLMMGR